MTHSETFAKVITDLVKSKLEFPQFINAGKAEVKLNDNKGEYSYTYLELPDILDIVTPILAKNNITIYQEPETEQDFISVTTWLFHNSGEWIQSAPFKLPYTKGNYGQKVIQTIGQLVTYCRRYAIQPVLGIAGNKDEDISQLDGEEASLKSTMQKPEPVKPEGLEDPFKKPTAEPEPEPESKPSTVEQSLFGSEEPESKPEPEKKTSGKQPTKRQQKINEIAGVLEHKFFKASDKTRIAELIPKASTLPKLDAILDRVTTIVAIANLMDHRVFTDENRDMMRDNIYKAETLEDLKSCENDVKQVIEIRSQPDPKEIY